MSPRQKKLRVLVLVHEDLIPPDSLEGLDEKEISRFKTEYDVCTGLQQLGHDVQVLGLRDELRPLRHAIREFEPEVAFNLVEEFRGEPLWDYAVVSYLELMGVAVTGCRPRGLILARDKGLSKKILHYHRIAVPQFAVFPRRKRVKAPTRLGYPLIVKSLVEDASFGISQASIVHNADKLVERVAFIHEKMQSDAIAEQFIAGREVYVSVLGNDRLRVLPLMELDMSQLPDESPRIATERVKFELEYQDKHEIKIAEPKDLDEATVKQLHRVSKRIYRRLDMRGYARLDFRIDDTGKAWFLEANPNPDIAQDEEFATSARLDGLKYNDLLRRVVKLALD